MSPSRLRHCLSGILAVGVLVLSVRFDATKAASPTVATEVYRSTEAITHVFGSKRAIGYFQTVDGQCELTLMISEATDPDRTMPWSAARLHFAMQPGQGAALASEEGAEEVLVCGSDAATVEVTHDASSVARAEVGQASGVSGHNSMSEGRR
jgi:hypothetical protein